MLQRDGADPLRLELVGLARRFKRSWLEMAEALVRLQASRSYEAWGFADLYGYCADELCIQRRTVDKLTGSYQALKQHAPSVLTGQDDARVPSYDALDYFARAVRATAVQPDDRASSPPEQRVIDELRQAVFDEGAPVSVLRRRFHDMLHGKTPDDAALEALERASATARRLASMLPGLDGVSEERMSQVGHALEALLRDLDELILDAREGAGGERAPIGQAS